jgi:nitrite reductase (NADH) small subunit
MTDAGSDATWWHVTARENIPPREGRSVRLAGRDIAIFNLGDRFLAVDDRCPHQGGPLSDGIVVGSSVVCPLHAWKVNLHNGGVERPKTGCDLKVRTYPVRVDGDIVAVAVPACGRVRAAAGEAT